MSSQDWGIDDPEETYWFNTHTKLVERGPQSPGVDRIGPFKSRAEAEHAQAIVNEKARLWNEEDNDES